MVSEDKTLLGKKVSGLTPPCLLHTLMEERLLGLIVVEPHPFSNLLLLHLS